MRISRTVLLGVAAWLAVVAVGSTAVWFVISSAGENVGTAEDAPAQAAATVPGPTPAGPQRTHRPGHPLQSPSGAPTARASTSPSPGPATGGSSTPPATSPPSSAPPATAPPARQRTWQGLGGFVTAKCRGSTVALVAAQPDDGFRIEVDNRGPVTIEVHYTGQEDQSGRQSEVRAHCVGGVPVFSSQSQGGGGGDN